MASVSPSDGQLPGKGAEGAPIPPGFKVVAMAVSVGGVEALGDTLAALPADFHAAIVIVQHRTAEDTFPTARCPRSPHSAADRAGQGRHGVASGDCLLGPSRLAPAGQPGRHPLPLPCGNAALLRPSADRLFESLAASFGERAIAVVLTGGGSDGSGGVPVIKRMGGVVIAQDTATIAVSGMPRSAIATGAIDFIVPLHGIASTLLFTGDRGRGG